MVEMTDPTPRYHDTDEGRRIAYHHSRGLGPGVVFLGGFMSDMTGTKALHLEQVCRDEDRSFLRFDYSGHGASSGAFDDGTISRWAADARSVIEAVTEGPQILVGSSMGGWIALLMARAIPERIAGLVTVAAAPDFTEDSIWPAMNDIERAKLKRDGRIFRPSDYGRPYTITRNLIEDGRRNLVLRDPLELPFPVRFLQGTKDTDVDMKVSLSLLDHAQGPDMRLVLVDGADHRFSNADCLDLICASIADVSARAAG